MQKFVEWFLSNAVSEKAAFAFSMFTAINEAIKAASQGVDATVDFAYQYLPAKYKEKATAEEIKSAIKSYITAYNKTEALFKK